MKKSILCILSLLLMSVMFVTIFTACKGGDKPAGGSETTGETENNTPTDKPDIKDGVLTFREGDGMTFDGYSIYRSETTVRHAPKTYEAWMKMPEDLSKVVGVVLSDYAVSTDPYMALTIQKDGVPQIYYKNKTATMFTKFNNVRLPANEWVHLAVVDDVDANTMYCYVNGELAQTVALNEKYKTFERPISEAKLALGNDYREGLGTAFAGHIRSIATYSVVRTQEEIKQDMVSIKLDSSKLISCYDMSYSQGKGTIIDQKGNYTFINNRSVKDWIDPSNVKPLDDFDYSIAFLGDTQSTVFYYPEAMNKVFDWLIANKDEHKIAHLLNGGDITEKGTTEEWEYARGQYFRLNGILDFTLTRGDHDVHIDTKGYDKTFGVDEYTSRFNVADAGIIPGTTSSMTNSYRKVDIGGESYLIVTLDYAPTTAEISWANTIIKKYPNEKVIITNHRYMDTNASRISEGESIFSRIANVNSNVRFCMCGHKITQNLVWRKDQAQTGQVVNQILVNPQGDGMDNKGPLGMVALFYFKKGSDNVQVRYYSTQLDKYFRETNQFTINMNDMSTPTVRK